MNTNDLESKRIYFLHSTKKNPDRIKKLGKIHQFVFHPSKSQLVGFLVKRPDVAWMFHREDAFVAFNGFDILEDEKGKPVIVIKEDSKATGKGALKMLGVKLDDCLLWIGLPVICEDKRNLGVVESVDFDPSTGKVLDVVISQGATANTLLGKRKVPTSMIKGFKLGEGAKLNLPETGKEDAAYGAIVVSDEAATVPVVGGVAETAGTASAIAMDKVQKTHAKVKKKVVPAIGNAGEKVQKGVEKGAFATGRQIARTEGMFKNFKDEFKKAMNDDDK